MGREAIIESFNRNRYSKSSDMDLKSHIVRYDTIIKVLKKYVKRKDVKILDVGCGPGNMGMLLLKEGFSEIWGMDISDESLKLASQNGMITIKANLEDKFPLDDKIFDVIIASEIIEHIYDTEFFVKEIKRVLKPMGILIITTPNVASIARRFMLLFGINPFLEYKLGGGAGHIRYFTFKDMRELLKENGFDVIEQLTDTVNILPSGKFDQKWIGKIFPTLGRCIITVAKS